MKKLLIKSGRVIDPATSFDQVADLLIVDGSIAQISDTIELSDSIDIVDARGKWVTAGLIDIHTHLRDPGFEYKEDISSGAASGAAGGFTTILCMPNSNPVNDNQEVTRYIIEKGKQDASITVLPVGALTLKLQGEQLASIDDMAKGGIVALSDDGRSIQNGSLMRAAMEQSKLYNLLLMEHAESYSFNSKGDMNEGRISAKLGLVGIPKIAEDIMVARLAFLAEDLDMKAHVSHISTKRSVDIVRWAKSRGVQISAEAAPHHFTLTEDAVGEYNSMAKMSPPLREQSDIDAIKVGLADKTIEAIASDHAPHADFEKEQEFDKAPFGIVGLETSLGLSMQLVHDRVLSASRLIEVMSYEPARLVNIDRGTLAVGKVADITIIDPNLEWKVDLSKFKSKSKNSPFENFLLKGKAVMTIVAGKIVYQESSLG